MYYGKLHNILKRSNSADIISLFADAEEGAAAEGMYGVRKAACLVRQEGSGGKTRYFLTPAWRSGNIHQIFAGGMPPAELLADWSVFGQPEVWVAPDEGERFIAGNGDNLCIGGQVAELKFG